MASIRNNIMLKDSMGSVLKNIVSELDKTTSKMGSLDAASRKMDLSQSFKESSDSVNRLKHDIEPIDDEIRRAANEQNRLNNSFGRGRSLAASLAGGVKSMIGAYIGIAGIKKAVDYVNDSIKAANIQIEAETKLETIMRKRMGATDEMIDSVKRLTAEQQKIGVIGDEIQLTGAQQLATFLNKPEALETLIPAMNNLAVQQAQGGAVTGESMKNIGNLMGKAMQGQTSALTRVGISFNAAQEEVLKYGTEAERAAMLTEVINDNVGLMNEAMRNTPQGQMQSLSNTFGDISEKVGFTLYPAVLDMLSTLNDNLPAIEGIMVGIGNVLSVVIFIISGIVDGLFWLSGVIGDVVNFTAPVLWILVGAFAALGIVKGVSLGIEFFSKVLSTARGGMLKFAQTTLLANWPILLIGAGIALVIYALINWQDQMAVVAGVITGILFSIYAFFYNRFYVPFYNTIASFVEFFANVWNDPVSAVKQLIYGLAITVVERVSAMAGAIESLVNAIPGVQIDLTGNIDAFADDLRKKKKELEDEKGLVTVDRITNLDYNEMFNKGYDVGNNASHWASDKLTGALDKIKDMAGMNPFDKDQGINYDELGETMSDQDYNVNVKDDVNLADESLKYMLEGVTQRYINNVNLTSPAPVMNVTINSGSDGIDMSEIKEKIFGEFGVVLAEKREASTAIAY